MSGYVSTDPPLRPCGSRSRSRGPQQRLTPWTPGYIGRILLNSNPWDSGAFQLQICTIIIAPTFICASIYLTLKHVAINLNPSLSRIPPQWYPRIFLPADLSCLVVQAIGGGIAAAAGRDDANLLKSGNNAIIAGIVLQVVVLAIFGLLGVDYYFRARRYMASPDVNPESLAIWRDSKTRTFGCAVMVAYAAVLIRCIYRFAPQPPPPPLFYLRSPFGPPTDPSLFHSIAEMAGGWGNHIMQDEPSFLVLDASLVAVAVTLLTVVHPGIYFPYMRNTRKPKAEKESPAESSSEAPKVAEAGV